MSLSRQYDNLNLYIKKHRVITEDELKPFIEDVLGKSSSLLRKIKVSTEVVGLLRDVPLTADERMNLNLYCKSFLPNWYRVLLCCGEVGILLGFVTLGNVAAKFIFSKFLCR